MAVICYADVTNTMGQVHGDFERRGRRQRDGAQGDRSHHDRLLIASVSGQ
jgi:hypothetical protein